ncbi:MAG: rfbC, partial [Conexibacter sp.]|nr:rfbC [Conexibacter sp.]
MPFELLPTTLDGPRLLAPKAFGDDRGFFVETYRRSDLMALGIQEEMVQDNHSRSTRGVLRGLHFTVG